MDSINERFSELGLHCLTIAQPYSKIFGKDAFGTVIALNGIISRANILLDLKHLVNKNYPLNNNPVVRVWNRVLKKVQPKIIIGIQPSVELCIAAKKAGIWVADLQHGILSDEGYYGKAYRVKYEQKGWPDCILCWDEESVNWIKNCIGDIVDAKLIGNPWFFRFIEPRANDRLVNSVRKMDSVIVESLTILVTLQWGIDPFVEYHETGIPLVLFNFIKEHGKDYTWLIRIHPVMMQEPNRKRLLRKFERAFKHFDNIIWESSSEDPLPVVLSQTNLHITSHSSVTVEASWFGIRTALFMNDRQLLLEYFSEQINNGFADILPLDQEAIGLWINKNMAEAKKPKSRKYMNTDSLDQFIEEVKQHIAMNC